MTEMVERVAAVIGVPEADGFVCGWSLEAARKAIAAMREPTSKMCGAACNALKRHVDSFTEEERAERWPGRKDDGGWRVPNKEKHGVRFTAMIDEALK